MIAKSSGSPVSLTGCGGEVGDVIWSTWTAVLCEPIVAPVDGVREEQVPERLLRRAVGLVAGRRRVREVVGDLVLADLLGEHAGRGDVETTVHSVRSIGRDAASCEAMEPVIAVAAAAAARPAARRARCARARRSMARVASRGESHGGDRDRRRSR